jgi:hypothetical protein
VQRVDHESIALTSQLMLGDQPIDQPFQRRTDLFPQKRTGGGVPSLQRVD